MFGEVFGEREMYTGHPPDEAYSQELLARPDVILLAALSGERVVGGLAGYRLEKFEQARREIYIYDLAVAADMRRRGIATSLIEAVRQIARESGCWMVFVQGEEGDAPALALYRKLAVSEEIAHHFDIAP